ncbi:MAG: FtsX-like permease family protein [Planctomycetota bacterium]|jgi:lipoprotein-releasing system permease protein
MYKLFLCLRYLRSRLIAYFAILGVALCVAMVLIVFSVMNGFLNKLQNAAKGLFGQVTISSSSLGGLKQYEELTRELKEQVPEVEAVTPFIATRGLLRVPGYDYRTDLQVVGIRLPNSSDEEKGITDYYSDVSNFKNCLFVQPGSRPGGFDPPLEDVLRRVIEDREQIVALAAKCPDDGKLQSAARTAIGFHEEAEKSIKNSQRVKNTLADLHRLGEKLDEAAGQYDQENLKKLRDELRGILTALGRYYREFYQLAKILAPAMWAGNESDLRTLSDVLEEAVSILQTKRFQDPPLRAFLGLGIRGLVHRTLDGQTVRMIVPGNNVVLTLVPLGRKMVSSANIPAVNITLTVIDDCRTDVSSIDSDIIYLPFETLQKLNDMDKPEKRCSELLVKVSADCADGEKLLSLCRKIRKVTDDFARQHPGFSGELETPTVLPWTERLADAIRLLERNRTLSVTMFCIISLVSVVLIFVIFYMMVVQKTREIGVLKAVGASNSGLAGIFLAYGAAIGLVGSVIGSIGGYYFVRYINEIQDLVDRWTGFRVWEKKYYLFEKIPNEVSPWAVLVIVLGALVAGLIGAIIPAVRAARMQPVEAIRYE